MRRLLLFIFVLLLVVDLADDGLPGKARFVSPVAPLSSSVGAFPLYDFEKVDSCCEFTLTDPSGISNHYENQTLPCRVQNNLKRIGSYQISSSGGIPL
jgi:hypothetical protein